MAAIAKDADCAQDVFEYRHSEPPLCAAIRRGCSLNIIKVLLSNGASLTAETADGQTPVSLLTAATRRGVEEATPRANFNAPPFPFLAGGRRGGDPTDDDDDVPPPVLNVDTYNAYFGTDFNFPQVFGVGFNVPQVFHMDLAARLDSNNTYKPLSELEAIHIAKQLIAGGVTLCASDFAMAKESGLEKLANLWATYMANSIHKVIVPGLRGSTTDERLSDDAMNLVLSFMTILPKESGVVAAATG